MVLFFPVCGRLDDGCSKVEAVSAVRESQSRLPLCSFSAHLHQEVQKVDQKEVGKVGVQRVV